MIARFLSLLTLFMFVVSLTGIVGCGSQPAGNAATDRSSGSGGSNGVGRFITEPGEYQLGDLWLTVGSANSQTMSVGFRWGQGRTLADTVTRDAKSGWFLYWQPPNKLWRYDGDKGFAVYIRDMGTVGAMLPLAWSLPVLADAPKEVIERIPADLRPNQGKQ
jgi:hypothetical protein